MNIEKLDELTAITSRFFNEISPTEFKEYLTELTSDAMLGSELNDRSESSNRVTMMVNTIDFINQINSIVNE